ncbi:hypothetical protein IFM89_027354 [Coptis chinensis]|uniref:Pentatricopeptide repeat-containing protein n=1 Tax=Coptis chinensis TaxID=261450 RepID=A0A835LSY9_9MAGN|nr:hypothetical protein IFM89_027354 [Coptis chinensis]
MPTVMLKIKDEDKGILLKLPHYNKACKLYDEMLESGIQPDIMAMTTLVAGHIQNNHVREAFKVFEKVFSHERFSGYYGVGAFTISNFLLSFPFLVMISVVSGKITECMMVIATLVLNYMMGIVTGAGCKVHMNLLMNWDP